ncbi:MAG: CopG family antitoxin [Spirochaetia bacterium]|nr:CopG family antitoxin [Spirochaetia bacterium]
MKWDEAQIARFPELKPTTKSISIRLPQDLIDDLKILAHRRDIPYQSLLKVLLAEKYQDEFGKKRGG